MRPRVILLGALADRAKVEADIDVRIQIAQMRHFHDKQIKIKKFRKWQKSTNQDKSSQ